ncbi:ThuA domain-containing protein [Haladaptatus sp. DYF46]|uniref:ThuA domain-containing protein n=1 Tax=Haladaptatus sp. DYF46 TaxID=2886041 RepID=UPI001E5C8605|nr:ThuA domain-containing protein [Haladaptatus sp. DYF46]
MDVGENPAILVLSVTAGYRHQAIPTGNQTIQELADEIATENGVDEITVDIIDDPNGDASAFPTNADDLAQYDVVVWNSTTGDVLNEEQQSAFEEYIQSGGAYAGIHAAADTEYEWEWYGGLVGAYFEDHPSIQTANVHVTDRTHPSTEHLPAVWERTDEWYDYQSNPRGDVHVLASLDESSYEDAGMDGIDHPTAWCQYYDGARSWYTGGGHTEDSYSNEAFRQHLKGGIMWAAGYVDGGASGTVWDNYTTVPLDTDTSSPAMVDIAPDGRVFYIERGTFGGGPETPSQVVVIDQDTPDNDKHVALDLTVYAEQEDGLLGILLDSDFENTGWVYLYYSPLNEDIDEPHNRLSRFTMEDGTIDRDSEVTIMKVPTQRETCCHTGGDMHWGPNGEQLYLTTGDDSNPFESSGYAPLDERDGREYYDSQRTAANTADLRGKILRIIPHEDGSYSTPDDNLFTGSEYSEDLDNGLVKPEIYIMGNRNPYRASVDHETGTLYWGDYGPDAGGWNAERGPPGTVEFNKANGPGFYGWPYFIGPNIPYKDYDFETGESGDPFDPNNPVNESPNNTGLTNLPTPEEAMIYYDGDWEAYLNGPDYAQEYLPEEPPFPQLQGGAPMAGSVFHYHDDYDPNRSLPESFEGKLFIMEWGAGWIKYVSFDDDGNVMEIDPFLPNAGFHRPMDMKVGPDGALYVVDWGSDFSGPNDDSGVYRIEHTNIQAPSINFSDGAEVTIEPGNTVTVEASLTNTTSSVLESGEVALTASGGSDIEVSANDGTTFDSLAAGETQSMSWDVTVPDSASNGTQSLSATTTYTLDGNQIEKNSTFSVRITGPLSAPFGFDSGGSEIDGTVTIDGLDFVAQSDAVQASGDSSASGNDVDVATSTTGDPIDGTDHDALYQSEQYGGNLSYDVAIQNGTYDVTLHFAELYWNEIEGNDGYVEDAEGQRVFDVSVQGESVLQDLDLFKRVGHDVAFTKTVQDVEVTNGSLSISTTTKADNSKFSGFEIQPTDGGGSGDVIEGGTTIELGGETPGWVGQAPGMIDGKTNPTLPLVEGESYTITFENLDGAPHDLVILDGNGDSLVSTDLVMEEGGTATIEFTASTEMAEYYCSVHPTQMRGAVTIKEGDSGGDGPEPVVGDSRPTDPDGDGKYEDVNGDGEENYDDIVDLFDNFEDDAVQESPDAFDFNENGQLDFDDIIELFRSQ